MRACRQGKNAGVSQPGPGGRGTWQNCRCSGALTSLQGSCMATCRVLGASSMGTVCHCWRLAMAAVASRCVFMQQAGRQQRQPRQPGKTASLALPPPSGRWHHGAGHQERPPPLLPTLHHPHLAWLNDACLVIIQVPQQGPRGPHSKGGNCPHAPGPQTCPGKARRRAEKRGRQHRKAVVRLRSLRHPDRDPITLVAAV